MSLPPSSPRLPSPPPAAEIQIGPQSPMMGPHAARQVPQIEQTTIDTNAKRRIHPGTKSADMAAGPPLVPLHELDSAFQLQEHLAALHYYHTASHTNPINRDTAKLLATPPPGIDKTLWLYELCRFLIAQCNNLIVGFLFDTPPCSAATCPEMRAGEWQFLCAVHDTPKSCCAIDYCCHTLDWAANVVTNPKIFPSRFVVDAHDKNTALKNLVNVFRRLHRIFAHAWFQHRGVFWSLESQSGLYVFFKTVCDAYDLLPAENYKLPPEAEGLDSSAGAGDLGDRGADKRQQQQQQLQPPITIAKPPSQRDTEDGDYSSMSRTNTRRHIKSSPSVGSAVTTVPEADEDDGTDLSHRLGAMRISAPRAAATAAVAEEEGGQSQSASIPVIVEHRSIAAAEQPVRPSSVIPPPETAPEPEPEAGTTKQETDTSTVPEHDFALEPELQSSQAPPEAEPASVPEPAVPEPEETQPSAAPAEDDNQQEAEEQQSTAAAVAVVAGDEPAPETKTAETETRTETESQEAAPSSTTTTVADEAGAEVATATPAAEAEAEEEADKDAEKEVGEKDAAAGKEAEEEKGKEKGVPEGGKQEEGEVEEGGGKKKKAAAEEKKPDED
ncbi:hypothetical protein C8A00DRAFT_17307 [Chaetomidium leptoderma]|uniref:Uncharacterized protein n=1 Tax=Chaetomidium leptoderma TaxID=669021 RepID=A0AAN6VJD4_9PEZI|nr:hypothetical protein C8A00DRAFT_17307 [Chaetomidium leptoderma]